MAGSGRQSADSLVALLLAQGKAVTEVAQRTKVAERTIYRRLQEPEFRAEISRLRGAMVEQAVGALADAGTSAVMVLLDLATGAKSENVRLGAARAVLELGTRLREQNELDDRITVLEAHQARNGT
jgi:hypothetical protein